MVKPEEGMNNAAAYAIAALVFAGLGWWWCSTIAVGLVLVAAIAHADRGPW